MAAAQSVVYFLLVLGITAALLSLFFTYLRPHCNPYESSHYEHFANPSSAEIDQRLVKDLQTMIDTITPLQSTLEILVDSIGEMKADTCGIYDEFHVNYVQSRGSAAPDPSEYTLPAEQQVRRQESRIKYGEEQWNAKKEFFQSYYKLPILPCESSTPKPIKSTPTCSTSKLTCTSATEGFALMPKDVPTLTYQLGEVVAPFQAVLMSSFGKGPLSELCSERGNPSPQRSCGEGLIQDCLEIIGTSLFINNQLQTILAGMKTSSAPQLSKSVEGFANYPIPFPVWALNPDQKKAYALLSDAQNVLDNFKILQNGLYKGTMDTYTQLNKSYQEYLAYKGQMAAGIQTLDSVQLTPPPPK